MEMNTGKVEVGSSTLRLGKEYGVIVNNEMESIFLSKGKEERNTTKK